MHKTPRRATKSNAGLDCMLIAITAGIYITADANAQQADTPREALQILFGNERQVCKSVAAALDVMHKRMPRPVYISQIRGQFLSLSGAMAPHWLDKGDPRMAGTELDGIRYFRGDVLGDGLQRVVGIQNFDVGMHGDYVSNLWLFKPRDAQPQREDQQAPEGFPSPSEIDLLVNFGANYQPVNYRAATLTGGLFDFPRGSVPSKQAKEALQILFNGGYASQEPIVFGNTYYFVAGYPVGGISVIYRINVRMKAEVVCLSSWQ